MLAGIGVATIALSACSAQADDPKVASLASPSSASSAPATKAKTAADAKRDFRNCLIDRGMNVDENGTIIGDERGKPHTDVQSQMDPKTQAALDECRKVLPDGGAANKLDPKRVDKMREQAKCLREHGLDAQDPDPNNPGAMIINGDGDRAEFEAAMRACGMDPGTPYEATAPIGGGK
ncbi:hypothetical protein [Actinokineospora sp. HUAS TT18]|uniref:hypothetical protein n=1 Tax=Actinokineospora sp. HUAS TT18 TaxID=3447451 RepID=UPI003F5259D4